ncbi:MAG: hypothetical protein ACREPT_04775 [Rudaea sp.]
MTNNLPIDNVLGRIDALAQLVCSLVAVERPVIADIYFRQVRTIKERLAKDGRGADHYEEGFCAFEQLLLATLSQVSAAEKVRNMSLDQKH